MVYAVLVVALIASIINAFRWKIATRALTLFCQEQLRAPTDAEIADYTKRAASKIIRGK